MLQATYFTYWIYGTDWLVLGDGNISLLKADTVDL